MALILTSIGEIDESLLEPFHEATDNEIEHTVATGYKFNGEVVQRSVHVHLKQGLSIFGEVADIS